jgi:hypothetical protein
MYLLTSLKKPISLLVIGMIIILLTVFFKTMGMLQTLQAPLFVFGFTLELVALVIFIKKNNIHKKAA